MVVMLDDGKFVQDLDRGNALGIIAGQPDQLRQVYDLEAENSKFKIQNVVLAGMGGSALAGEFCRSWLGDRIPVPMTIVRDYSLPAFVGPETLVIVSSYSGNTEETLEALEQARERQARVVIMTSGGKLLELAKSQKVAVTQIPAGYQPRMALAFEVKAFATILEQVGLLKGLTGELEAAADWLVSSVSKWVADSATEQNAAKQIALDLVGKAVVVYGGPVLSFAALKWKIGFNENAKNLAFSYPWPEFNHNEFLGWLHPPVKQFKVVELQSELDHPEIGRRFEISNRLLSGKMPNPIIIKAEGETKLQQMLWSVALGDFTSAYLAFLNGIDPTPVEMIEKLKRELASNS